MLAGLARDLFEARLDVGFHEIRAETHEECWPLLANSFTVPNWEMSSRWTEYGRWLLTYDLVPTYQEYKQCLQVMADRTPGKGFVLKCPDHLSVLDSLLEVFPDACIVWTHRDPVGPTGIPRAIFLGGLGRL